MIRSLLIGLVAGLRSMTPLAAVSLASRGRSHGGHSSPGLLDKPAVSVLMTALSAAEAFGDKLPFAPDRIIAPGIAARIVTGGLAGAALAARDERVLGAALGAAGAVAAAHLSFGLRVRAMRRFGQVPTGLVEDAIAIGAAWWLAREPRSQAA